jgi:hypothetical protein
VGSSAGSSPFENVETPGNPVGILKCAVVRDEIDTVLAGHHGFTAEELDFILNYDIKYRLGRDTESEAED